MHIPILIKRPMGIFRSFVKTYGLVQGQSIGIETGAEFLPTETSLSFGRPEKVEHTNMFPQGLVCICTRFLAKESSTPVTSLY